MALNAIFFNKDFFMNTRLFLYNFILLSSITPAICMESVSPHKQLAIPSTTKPVIEGNLYINFRDITRYAGPSFITKWENAGIKSLCSNPHKVPFVPVFMTISADTKNPDRLAFWNQNNIPNAIIDYENAQRKEITRDDKSSIMSKTFPDSIPADLLYNCVAGSQIHLTVHGYSVIATCRNNPHLKKSFKKQFDKQIERFKCRPSWFFFYGDDMQQLIDEGIIIEKKFATKHGPNGFKSLEAIMFEGKKTYYGSQYNYVMKSRLGKPGRAPVQTQTVDRLLYLQRTTKPKNNPDGLHGAECIIF
jgi:hypothetical protein